MHLAVITTFPPSRATLCEYAEHLVRALASKPEVTQLSVIADEITPGDLSDEIFLEVLAQGDETWCKSVTVHRTWRFNDPSSTPKIVAALRKIRPDAVLCNLQFASFGNKPIPAALGLFAPLASRLAGFPTITLLHNLIDTVDLKSAGYGAKPLLEAVLRFGGNLSTRALLGSHCVAVTLPHYLEHLQRHYRAQNVFLAPHGSFHRSKPAPLPAIKTVMTFGKFGTYKRLEALLDAHMILLERDPNVRLIVAGGDAPNAPGYIAGIRERFRHVPNLSFTGYVPENEVQNVFTNCTVVAFPYSSTTGSSGPLHQAGEFARAAVMPRIGDLAELITAEGYAAEFFEPENAVSLAEALWRALEPNRALELGLINHAAAMCTPIEDVVELYLEKFADLKGSKSRGKRKEESRKSPHFNL
jgi:glycosyltransferase involved in cell wall biosynthesis